jgi:hypothetical protein
MKLKGRA